MELSVIIVNYNVKHFLEQCLFSVRQALTDINGEVIIVDNNSVDGSGLMVREKFPEYIYIQNQENKGFSKANNQGIKQAKGQYILLLNPDTVVEEDTFRKCIKFMDSHPEAGAMGVKMIDGKGRFLPESKRSLPKPSVAFYKIFGLSKLFPNSRIFGRYNLGFLSQDQIHEVDILPGAFMFLRKKTLQQTGILDEDYFMYGEDIDLSYRIIQSGLKNYYYPETTIIHYKGESTKKSSLNYVALFYKAMIIFADKHFSKSNANMLSFFIRGAIYFRAAISVIKRVFGNIILPLADITAIYAGYLFMTPLWEKIKFPEGGQYPREFLHFIVPGYILIWIITNYLWGGYDRPIMILKHIKGVLIGSLLILIIYALLPLDLRFSRVLIFLGTLWALLSTLIIRIIFHLFWGRSFTIYSRKGKRILIAGGKNEVTRIKNILVQTKLNPSFVGYISPPNSEFPPPCLGNFNQMEEIIDFYNINEVIFCIQDISAKQIISRMIRLSDFQTEFKIAPPETLSVIGSNSIHTSGDLYLLEVNAISKLGNRRLKRLFDIATSLLFIISYPILIGFIKNPIVFGKNILRVLSGKKSWVGYTFCENPENIPLPIIKPGVLSPADGHKGENLSVKISDSLNVAYAKNYRIINDIIIILKSIRELGKD